MSRRAAYRWFALAVAIAAGIFAFRMVSGRTPQQLPREISAAAFLDEVAQGNVAKVEVSERTEIRGVSSRLGPFVTKMKVDRKVANELRARGVTVEFERFSAAP